MTDAIINNHSTLSASQTAYDMTAGDPTGEVDGPDLIDTFYDFDNDDVFNNWYGDAVADHDDKRIKIIKCMMNCIKVKRENAASQARSESFLTMLQTGEELQRDYADFGKEMFELIHGYMEKASENCK